MAGKYRSSSDALDVYSAALGRAIKVVRTEQGMDRTDLAEQSGLSYPYLSEIENGKKRPSSRSLEAIAEALGMRPHELMAAADSRMSSVEAAVPMAMRAIRGPSWF